ncbi:MAG: hypothetical protein U0792_17515 [Gemmataceae bacterium]
MSEQSEPPADSPKPEPPWVHGSHLVCAIRSDPDGTRFSTCPVCAAQSTLPTVGGWLNTKCHSCGCEFISSDGSPPPEPKRPRAVPLRRSLPKPPPTKDSLRPVVIGFLLLPGVGLATVIICRWWGSINQLFNG